MVYNFDIRIRFSSLQYIRLKWTHIMIIHTVSVYNMFWCVLMSFTCQNSRTGNKRSPHQNYPWPWNQNDDSVGHHRPSKPDLRQGPPWYQTFKYFHFDGRIYSPVRLILFNILFRIFSIRDLWIPTNPTTEDPHLEKPFPTPLGERFEGPHRAAGRWCCLYNVNQLLYFVAKIFPHHPKISTWKRTIVLAEKNNGIQTELLFFLEKDWVPD